MSAYSNLGFTQQCLKIKEAPQAMMKPAVAYQLPWCDRGQHV